MRTTKSTPENAAFLPYGRQDVDETDIALVVSVLRGAWLTQGPMVTAFERALAATTGARDAAACANGTAALHLAALALDLEPKDAVIAPSITFLATASAAHHAGGTPVFADVDPDTALMTPATAAAAIDRARAEGLRPRALFPVHYAGQLCDMPGLAAVAAAHGLTVVEDACHALGGVGTWAGEEGAGEGVWRVGGGAHAAMTAFSFHPVKTIAAGEGGAVAVNDPALAERLRRLRNHGVVREPAQFVNRDLAFAADGAVNPWHHEMHSPGFNYRLSDLHAALGLSQLRRLDAFVSRRAALMARYAALLTDRHPLVRPLPWTPHSRTAWHLCVALIDFDRLGVERHTVMARLAARGVGSQVHYIPVHRQPFWAARGNVPTLPGAEAFYRRALSLPLFPAMTDDDVDRVAEALFAALEG